MRTLGIIGGLGPETNVRISFILMYLLILFATEDFSASTLCAASKSDTRLAGAWNSFYSGEYKKAGALVAPLMKSSNEEIWTEAKYLAARILWTTGNKKNKQQAKVLWEGLEKTTTRNVSKIRRTIVEALKLADLGQFSKASDLLNPILVREYNKPVTVEAAILLSQFYMDGGRIDDAHKARKFAISFATNLKNDKEINHTNLGPFLKAAKKLNIYDPAEKGFDLAQQLRRRGKFAAAFKGYNRVITRYPGSKYKIRSVLHQGHCFLGLKQVSKAIKHWTVFINEKPSGSWRGQAYEGIIDASLAIQHSPELADEWAEKAKMSMEKASVGDGDKSWSLAEGRLKLLFGLLHLSANRGELAVKALKVYFDSSNKHSKKLTISLC